MPLVRISLRAGRDADFRRRLSDAVHQAMVDTISIPADDRFQLIHEHAAGDVIYDAGYMGIPRTDDLIMIQITLNAGRTIDQKKALYRRMAERLGGLGVRGEDVLINLIDVPKENWSFGRGEAPYAK